MAERIPRRSGFCSVALMALTLQACAGTAGLPSAPPPQAPPSADSRTPPVRVLDWYYGLRELDATELARTRKQYADKAANAEIQLRQALLAAHPQAPNLARARSLLEGLLANTADDARALHPLAHLLLEQLGERQRLEAQAQRLGQQVERGAQQLKEAQQQSSELQAKLDALTEIERSLQARPPLATPPAERGPQ